MYFFFTLLLSLSFSVCAVFRGSFPREANTQNGYFEYFMLYGNMLTFVESSSSLVCSAINRTQKQLRCISGGHFECEKAGLLIIGLLMPPEALSISGIFDKSSDSDCGIGMEP